MTDTLGSATSAAGTARGNPLTDAARSEAAERLRAELEEYLAAQAQRLLVGFGRKLGEATVRLNDMAEGNSPGLARLALDGGRKLVEGKGPLRSALEAGASRAKDSVTGALRNLGGGKGRRKGGAGAGPTVIIEQIDVGVPLRTAYDQWTRYQDFSTFAKGVKSASRADDTTSDWQLKIWWSNRSWKAHTTEQVPDDRISWTSEGAKGTTKGVISFHRLADGLTRVLMVIEYYPKGLFEKTGNLWRAQGRRARLDLKNYARFVTLRGEVEEGWRGEIRDGEVVTSHEDALAEETGEEEDEEYEDEAPYAEEENGESGEYDEYEEEEPEAEPAENVEEESEEVPADEFDEVPEDEDEEVPADELDEVPEDEDEDEYVDGGSRR
ncbi:SRPBCC family protein [Streptomyces sp. HUAS ZL42]|uniref:SRPBCC family protein n=1 Tax=Streptomyces sp. HUAS ZL42 TaxID=3231715 RepID=UPI00345E2AED